MYQLHIKEKKLERFKSKKKKKKEEKKRGRRKGGRARGMEGAWEAPGRPIAEGLVASSRNLDETVLSQMTPPCPRYTV